MLCCIGHGAFLSCFINFLSLVMAMMRRYVAPARSRFGFFSGSGRCQKALASWGRDLPLTAPSSLPDMQMLWRRRGLFPPLVDEVLNYTKVNSVVEMGASHFMHLIELLGFEFIFRIENGQKINVEKLWQDFFKDPLQWWDHRSDKINTRYPDFKHKKTQEALWLNGKWNPPWVEAELAAMPRGTIQANIFSWNTKLARYVKDGQYEKTMELFQELQQHGPSPDKFTYVHVLKACARLHALERGRSVHKHIIHSGYESDIFVANSLVNVYVKCGSMVEGLEVFNKMLRHDVVSWNTMILGYVKCGQGHKAMELYDRMQLEAVQADVVTFVGILKACASVGAVEKGRHIHEQIIRCGHQSDCFVGNSLVDMYAKFGTIGVARQVFNLIPTRKVASWNAMILGYVRCGQPLRALELSQQMQLEGVEPIAVTFVGLLNACASLASLKEGQQIHKEIIKKGFDSDVFVGSSLIDMYAKCGSIDDAWRVFTKIPRRDLVAWTAMIQGYVRCGQGRKALDLSQHLAGEAVDPDPVTFVALLNACASVAALKEGRHVHEQIIQSGFLSYVFVGNSLIDMYSKCGSIDDAYAVFRSMRKRDVVTWTTMIQAYGKCRQGQKSFELFQQMLQEGVEPDHVTFLGILNACATAAALEDGRCVHKQIIQRGWESNLSISNGLLDMYYKCGSEEDALKVFNNMPAHNVVTWNSMICGQVNFRRGQQALVLYRQMQQEGVEPVPATFVGVLNACASLGALEEGRSVHEEIVRRGCEHNLFVNNGLLDMYFKCGSLEAALTVFNGMRSRNVVSWNAMIQGYVKCGQWQQALDIYRQMQQEGVEPEPVTFVAVLNACATAVRLEEGRCVHKQIIQSGCQSEVFVCNSLIHMYIKCGSMEAAWSVFDNMPKRDVVSWNTLIQGFVKCGQGKKALELSQQMQLDGTAADPVTFVGLLNACAGVGALSAGRCIHERAIQSSCDADIFVANSLIDMYIKCGSLEDAWRAFNKMQTRDVISWNAMILGYVKCGHGEKALELFKQMQADGVLPNPATFVALLNACASIGALQEGKCIHKQIIQMGYGFNVSVGTSLIDMYAKCSSLQDAWTVFKEMPNHNVFSWTAMLGGYAMHGLAMEALQHFNQMCQVGVEPDSITLISLLSAFSHAGLVEEGLHYFASIKSFHTVSATVEHYACIVDLLGRAGRLHQAEDLIKAMSCNPDTSLYLSLLAACRVHGNVEMGERIAQRVVELDPQNAAGDVLLSNIYASAGNWNSSTTIKWQRLKRGAKKQAGCTWIEVNNELHSFRAGDQDHPQIAEIHAELKTLSGQMEEAGYVPDTSFMLHNVEEDEKVARLCHHSEKLAIAFGLISTPPHTPIRIFKNLRGCGDCHTATKFISRIVGRVITVRDTNRFHHFQDGLCSCKDYW